MAGLVKLPITNVLMGGGYTGTLVVGSRGARLAVIIDTGSSTLAVDGTAFDPLTCPDTRTTNLVQSVVYGAGGWLGASVQTSVGLPAGVALADVPLAVTYTESAQVFGGAQGILGLAYAALDHAYLMPGDSWRARYDAAQVATGTVVELAPYFMQLERAGLVHNKFALYTRRAATSLATDDPPTDPDNQGVLVIGGGEEATEFYVGEFTHVDVVHDVWYETRLLRVQVGSQPAIPVAPVPAGSPVGSNSIVDSGTNVLLFDQPVYDAVMAAFAAIDPAFVVALRDHAVGGAGLPHARLDLAAWPPLTLTFLGADGAPAALTVAASNYWQLDAAGPGLALAYVTRDGSGSGRSIMGLPLFAGYYTVFDRSADGGRGVIRFATRA